jgi:hypothetical protein
VKGCDQLDSPAIELYFYDELDPAARARVIAHLDACAECRQRVQDLGAIGRALAARPRVDAPPSGDWSGFMRRLDHAAAVGSDTRSTAGLPASSRWSGHRRMVAIAATFVLVSMVVLLAPKFRSKPMPAAQSSRAAASPVPSPTASERTPDRALMELSEQHFERSKLVVLGLTSRDPRHTRAEDWEYERDLAGSLLSDTRLYRLAAQDRGLSEIAHVMGDLETVLLEASMSDEADASALERVQRLIRKRDLVVKMQVVGTGI